MRKSINPVLVQSGRGTIQSLRLLQPAEPLNFDVQTGLPARLNVLVPGLAMHCMSGGPNTALNIAYRMAANGVPVRYIATGVPPDADTGPLWRHICDLSGVPRKLPNVEIISGHDRSIPLVIGKDDVFFATAWWTAQIVKSALPAMSHKRFIYLVQDFEPGLHAYSTQYAMALETYGFDYFAIVNHPLLFDYLATNRVGLFGRPDIGRRVTVLNPAIDRTHFFYQPRPAARRRTLLFYARPSTAMRNLFELGIAALDAAVRQGVFDKSDWELQGIGDPFPAVLLGGSREIRPLPWMSFNDYAARMRSADILLSLMLSPHPSYPPLEMAATGGLAITNTFATKTAEKLRQLSPNIVAAEPTLESLVKELAAAVSRCDAPQATSQEALLAAPGTWEESLAAVLPFSMQAWHECLKS
jgi:O-antigen biosynthesis protein